MNILVFPVLLFFSAAWTAGAAQAVDAVKLLKDTGRLQKRLEAKHSRPLGPARNTLRASPPAIQSCDMSVIEPALARKNWKNSDGKEWTVIKMENGFALCLFYNRYLLFNENINSLVSVEEESGGIVVAFRGKSAQTYFVNSRDLLSKSLPYRGYPAETAYWSRVIYDKNVSTKAVSVILRVGSSIDKRLDAVIERFASQNPFWSNPNVIKEIKRWTLEEKGKETLASLSDFEPQIRLLLIPEALAAPSFEERALPDRDGIVSVPDVELARFICGDVLHTGEKSPHKILTTSDLLPLLDEER